MASLGAAQASERWEEAGSGAVAILPQPSKASTITGGSLSCAEQRWRLRLRTDPRPAAPPMAIATIKVDGKAQSQPAAQDAYAIDIAVPAELMAALKRGNRLDVAIDGDADVAASFALRGSGAVLTAITPLCSQIDMTGFERIALSDIDPAVQMATPLLKDDIAEFRVATSATPSLSAALLDRPDGRQLLFASLCGSTWYYGRTGCGLYGFARLSATETWRLAYNSEGMALYLDPAEARDGWPGLVTVLQPGGTERMHWRWDGSAYAFQDDLSAQAGEQLDGEAPEGEGDIAQ